MRHRRLRLLTALLTVVMTIGAGLPCLECRCPNGRVHPFGLAWLLGTPPCCGSACCASRPETIPAPLAAEPDPPSCCTAHAPEPAVPAGEHVERTGCQRTPSPRTLTALRTLLPFLDDGSLPFQPFAEPVFLLVPDISRRTRTAWLSHAPAPPLDRILLLSRLLI